MPHVASHHPSAKPGHTPAGGTRPAATGAGRTAHSQFASLLDEVGQPSESSAPAGGPRAQSTKDADSDASAPSSPATAGEDSSKHTAVPTTAQIASRPAGPMQEPEPTDSAPADAPQTDPLLGQTAGAMAPVLPETAADLAKGSGAASDADGKAGDAKKKETADTAAQAPTKPVANVVVIIPLPAAAAATPVAMAPAQPSPSDNAASAAVQGVQGPGPTSVLPASIAAAQPAGPAAQSVATAAQQADPAADGSEATPQAAVQTGPTPKPDLASPHKGKSDAAASQSGTPAVTPPAIASDSETSAGIQPPASAGPENTALLAAGTAKPAAAQSARDQAPQPRHGASQASAGGAIGDLGSPGDATGSNQASSGTGSPAFTVTASSHTAAASSTSSAGANAGLAATGAQALPVPIAGIAVAIAGRALAGNHHFDIRLDPPELGRIEVRLKVDRDGQVTSHLIADRRDTLDLLRRDVPGLERALQDAGLKTAGNGLQFSLRDQSGGGQDGSRPRTPNLIVPDDTAPALNVSARSYSRFAGRIGGLDIRV